MPDANEPPKKSAAVDESDTFDEDQVKKDMYGALKSKFHEVNELNREQERTINFQKAKIAAL